MRLSSDRGIGVVSLWISSDANKSNRSHAVSAKPRYYYHSVSETRLAYACGAVSHASWSMVHVIAIQILSSESAYVILANGTRAIGKAR
jgi:hypothetical protein